ncbi:MAG TPA: hypothetical protein VGL86_00755 [Polyangia bacterium]|jgi:hypothetical protein
MRNLAVILLTGALTLSACGDNNDNVRDFSMPGGDDMTATEGGDDMSMRLPPDMTPVDQIQAVKNAINAGMVNFDAGALDLPLVNVVVTYLHPLVGTDPAGFFVQDHPTGPAIFIAVDPATPTPAPVVGDTVSFTVTGVAPLKGTGSDVGLHMVTALSGWSRSAQGFDVSSYTQDVSNKSDLVSMLDNYEGTLIKMSGTIAGNFSSSGIGSVQAVVTTMGMGIPDMNATALEMRLPSVLQDQIDAVATCSFTVEGVPLWRDDKTPQPSAWVAADIAISNCPAPRVASAVGTTATTVRVKLTRNIKPSTFMSDGSQFMIDGGLTVTGATLSGRFVTLTTSVQTPLSTYTVTAATTLHDLLDVPLDAAHTTATFGGYTTPAQLVINEVNQTITGGHDLVELRVTAAGNTSGIVLQQDFASPTTLAVLPALAVAVDDLIVVHLNPVAGVTNETNDVNGKAGCVSAAPTCFPNAWDLVDSTTMISTSGITNSDRLLAVVQPDGTYQDVVPFTTLGKSPSGFPGELQAAQAAGTWTPADCGNGDGTPCTFTTTPSAETISVSWKTNGSTTATSVARKNPAGTLVQTKSAADWNASAASTFGAPNP